jgi:hypothetical protein
MSEANVLNSQSWVRSVYVEVCAGPHSDHFDKPPGAKLPRTFRFRGSFTSAAPRGFNTNNRIREEFVMLMADTMAIFFVILGLMLAFPGLWLLCRGLWPAVVSNADEICARGLIRPFLLGAPITAVMVVAAGALSDAGAPGKVSAAVVVCVYLMVANCGVAGMVTSIGARLPSPDDPLRPWRTTLRGGIVLELAFLLPILGWFGILPLAMTIGSGAAGMGLLQKLRASLTRRKIRAAGSQPVPQILEGAEQ